MSYPIKNYTSLAIATLQNLIAKNPLLFVGLLWFSLITSGAISLMGILNPGPKLPQQTIKKPLSKIKVIKQTPEGFTGVEKNQQKQDEGLPVWLYIVIPLTCATGSLLIVRHINLSKRRKLQTKKRKKSAPKITNDTALVVSNVVSEQKLLPSETVATPEITILPPTNQNLPQEDLVEFLDLRKQKSLQQLLAYTPQEQWVEEEITPYSHPQISETMNHHEGFNPPPPPRRETPAKPAPISYSIKPKKLPPQS